MTFLIVDDCDTKSEKIKSLLLESVPDDHLTIVHRARNNAECVVLLKGIAKVDILILDINLPIRFGEEIKKKAGLKLLNEINRRNELTKPEAIIGLTADNQIVSEVSKTFSKEGWTICYFDLKESDWEDTIKNKINYLLTKEYKRTKVLMKTKILFVAASPEDQDTINVGIEQRKIDEVLQLSSLRSNFELISKPSAKLDTLTRELMQHKPEFLHFSGHGANDGLVFETDAGGTCFVPNVALHKLFGLVSDTIKCVVLSACYSSVQAEAISKNKIYVVGMNEAVGIDAAMEFSKGFYQAIGEGTEISRAFQFGLVHLTSNDLNQIGIPELWFDGKKIS